ncbi:MogA/MoaB family molybdenum cofactor biosynthesis protein [Halorubrum lacusprofundi]|jgi:molybdenum cofactor biosynthesis protein B|uniref:Molybdenum cofactor synthesis domain protein n=1 Tax=Halorubrum lacusprofundi (strain ATCC 49239 / DSM 5036 / JCM 8891 / ACAM 34) TaxID=416348 RepID=B9LQA0_HALLT|nr:MogA/MoaB family molybdenum cofactor biosynthesis protein [Halorubrum lacusprofundi]ACM57521.1 molybdenum cofactor synthesis domain protein [Halorubrum lacusprofundi ATCC 49239]MCG1005882.1 MogA/MoaB family molybdenum cofactor biosynthesis protein [Halorubrum lacusprofundi]
MSDAGDGHDHDHHDESDHNGQHDATHDGQHDATHDDHDHHDHDADSVAIAVVTVSSSRSLDEDPSGDHVVAAFEDADHETVVRELIPDEYDSVQGTVDRLARRKDTDAVVTTGGTGVTPDDVTPEAVKGLFAKTLPGFGELFRRLSYEEIGTRTIGSRAIAGVVSATPVFCLPGSENAVRIGVDEVILPEIGHLVGLAGRGVEDAEEAGDDVEGEIGGNGTKEGDDVETDDTETDDAE